MRFFKNIVTFAALCATFASALTQNATDGYYELSSAQDLREFVDLVNGLDERSDEEGNPEKWFNPEKAAPNLNARLMQDIRVGSVEEGSKFDDNHYFVNFASNPAQVNFPETSTWQPINNFSGTFDGQGYSISGIFVGADPDTSKDSNGDPIKDANGAYTIKPKVYATTAGFFINLLNGAEIKDLRITDSYFAANGRVGSLAATTDGNVTVKGYQFEGMIYSDDLRNANDPSRFAGGIIGEVKAGELTASNIIAEGSIQHGINNSAGNYAGGLIGLVSGTANLKNCYSKVQIVNKYEHGIHGTKKGKVDNNSSVFCAGSGTDCNARTVCGQNTALSVCKKAFGENIANYFNEDANYKAYGVIYDYDIATNKLIAHITEWMKEKPENEPWQYKLDENGDKIVLDTLNIPKEMFVDSVDFDRVFSGKNSTIMLPFDIVPSKVTAISKCIVDEGEDFKPLKFNTFDSENASISYDENEKKYQIGATTEISEIKANTPYLVDGVKGNIHFCGPVTLKAVNSKTTLPPITIQDQWKFVGTYKTMLTTSGGKSDYEKDSNLGRIYGFVGTENVPYIGESTFSIGQFAKAGHNVRTREMRAYLIYSGKTIAPMAAPPYKNMNRAAPAATVLDLSGEDLPNSIDVIVDEKEIVVPKKVTVVDSTLKPTKVVATITFEYPSAEDDDEENAEEGTTAITKPFISPLKSNKVESWRDIKGRRLNGSPNVPGTYFKNGIPVIIK